MSTGFGSRLHWRQVVVEPGRVLRGVCEEENVVLAAQSEGGKDEGAAGQL